MMITLNGAETQTQATSVLTLLAELGLSGKPVVIELNEVALLKSEHAMTSLTEGDRIEVVTLAAGG